MAFPRERLVAIVTFALAAAFTFACAAASARAADGPYAGDWPMLGRTNAHAALATDPSITPARAKTLGIRWMANLYGADLGSPIVAYDRALGKMIVYAGNERGDVVAYDAVTGALVWSTNLGVNVAERDTPLFVNGSIFIGTAYNQTIFKLDGATGQIRCTARGPASFLASPISATPPGGQPMVYESTIDEPGFSGPFFGLHQSDCSQVFKFLDYVTPTGPWASPAYAVDATGEPLVVFGTADPDAREYAIDALTGARVWDFKAKNPAPYVYDIGAAADISPPGANGFADGVVYVPSKYGIMYALDLTTGNEIWEYDFQPPGGIPAGGLSSPALVGNDLVFGYNGGMDDLNATTGALVWQASDPTGTEVVASPAIVGLPSAAVVAFSDIAGTFRVIARANGSTLYAYQTHGYVTASPAESGGTFYVDSSDGFLYAFAPGGSNAAPPTTTITAPAAAAAVAYGTGTALVRGTAAGAGGIAAVDVAVQTGGATGPWYDAATNTWNLAPVPNPATLVPTAGGASWSLRIPLPPGGSTMSVIANAVSASNVEDTAGARESFTTKPSPTQPRIVLSASIVPPGGTVTATTYAFAPHETVTFSIPGRTLGSAVTGNGGGVPAVALAVPANLTFGPVALTATGGTSGKSSSTTLDIENAWTQYGYDGTRVSFEPNDDVLPRVLHTGPNVFLTRAYDAASSAPIESSPAIYDNIAFFGNDAGVATALSTSTSIPLWQFAAPSGKAMRGAPAIDGGYAFFPSDDGTLYALSAADGTLLGTTAIGGELTSPAAAGGIVYVASRGGTVAAVNESSGTILWSHAVGNPISSSVSLDAANQTLIVTDDGGYVTAYDAVAGTRLWHVEVGGKLADAAAISDGVVYVGSSNGNVYARNETYGGALWTYAEGSAISATPAVATNEPGFTGPAIFVGAEDATLTALAANGTRVNQVSVEGPVVALSVTDGNIVMAELANGQIIASRGPNDGKDFFDYQTAGSLDTQPAIVSGAVYVGAGDGGLYAFTPYGKAPLAIVADGARARLAALAPRAPWAFVAPPPRTTASARAMLWNGPPGSPVHALVRLAPGSGSAAVRFHGGPVQRAPRTYVVYWAPAGTFVSPRYAAATSAWLASAAGGGLAGVATDRSPLPYTPNDAAFSAELARVAASRGWPANANARFLVLPAREAFGERPAFCAYHGVRFANATPFVYAVIPYPAGAGACGAAAGIAPSGDFDADRVLPTLAREDADIASDPLGTGWFDAAGREAHDFVSP